MNAPMIASRIAKGAAPFLSARQFAALAIESEGDIWCTGVFGEPGFARATEQTRLSLDLGKLTSPVDPMLLDAAERMGYAADLFFIATGHRDRGLDASHRGGFLGFVTVLDESTLVFPDYPSISLFNSLGNLMIDHQIGLLVPDLARGKAVRISGTASVEFRDSAPSVTTTDAPRLVKVSISRWDEIGFPVYSSKLVDYSPFNP